MAYNGYFPQGYYPQGYYTPQNASATSNNGINWVQGEVGAKSFPVGAGQSVFLMDSENSVFYIKTVDQSGMPQPLRIFDYTERNTQNAHTAPVANNVAADFVSRSEFDEFKEDVKRSIKGIRKEYEEGEG